DLRMVGQETAAAWGEAVTGHVARGLRPPVLAVIDGNPGLRTALRTQWPGIPIGRCAVHKLRNPARQGPGAAAGGTRRGLPPDDLRGEPRAGREGADHLREEVVPAVPARDHELGGGRRRTLHVPALPRLAVEGAPDDELP